ncbi:conserved hypothetical protein [sediment metagenome]|uniref:Uncharacterized protein n=1 Tax=sediment metagenome TaxID=749907 RepID=D9PEU2_9ZZZZ
MKKFEIINDKWIKSIPQHQSETNISAMKIKSVSLIQSEIVSAEYEKEYHVRYFISLTGCSDDVNLTFRYKTEEIEQFKSDLEFLENLIYNK